MKSFILAHYKKKKKDIIGSTPLPLSPQVLLQIRICS